MQRAGQRRSWRWAARMLVPVVTAAAVLVPAAMAAGTADAATSAPTVTVTRTAPATAAAPKWWDYNTFVPDSRLSDDVDYDFSAKLTGDMVKVAAKHLTKVSAYLNALQALLQVVLSHGSAVAIVGLVGSLLAVAGMNLKKWYKIIKTYTKKGKHTKNGFWSRTFVDLFGPTYRGSHWRSCTAKTIKCGSPGFWHLHGTVQAG
jgi:hypothetical protein